MAVWLLGWTVATLGADAALGVGAYRQARAATFPTTGGVITRCEVRTERDAEGPTHHLDVTYDYAVNGRRFTGTRYSYGEIGTNTRAWHHIRDEMPPGTRVSVSYDPDDAGESLLRPGFTGFHLMTAWFLTPFNLVMVGVATGMARARRPAFDPNSTRCVVPTATGYRVHLPAFGRAGRFAVALLAITFCGIFVWAFGFGFNPPVPVAGWSYLGAVVVAVLVAARHTPRWLEVDEVARVLRLSGQPEPVEVPFAAIRDVTVNHEEHKDSDGDGIHHYHCELIRTEAEPLRFATFRVPEGANALAAWLRERVGLVSPSA
jgi:hypothetical protein